MIKMVDNLLAQTILETVEHQRDELTIKVANMTVEMASMKDALAAKDAEIEELKKQ